MKQCDNRKCVLIPCTSLSTLCKLQRQPSHLATWNVPQERQLYCKAVYKTPCRQEINDHSVDQKTRIITLRILISNRFVY